MSTERTERAARLKGVDAVRLVAFVAVCFVHTARWRQAPDATPDWVDALTLPCRFCVPFFFLASGYFAAGAERRSALPRLLGRIGLIFAVWALVYIALTPGGLARLGSLKFDLLTLLDGGPGFHLWFLPALAIGAMVSSALGGGSQRTGWTIALAAWLLAWLASAFGPGRAGAYVARYLIGVAFVLAGALTRAGGAGGRPRLAVVLILGGLALDGIEASLPDGWRARPFRDVEFPLGTGLLGDGAFLGALAWRPRSAVADLWARLGRRVLGLYAVHLGAAMLLFAVLPFATFAQRLEGFALTVVASIACVELLRRTPLRRIVE